MSEDPSFDDISETLSEFENLQQNFEQTTEELQTQLEQKQQMLAQLNQELEQEKEDVTRKLQELVDFEDVDSDELNSFVDKPYTLVPKAEDEMWVIVPRWVPFNIGYLAKQDESYNHFVVNKYINWISELPSDIKDSVGIEKEFKKATVEDSIVEFADAEERDRAWDMLGGRDGGLYQRKDNSKIKIKSGNEFDVIAKLIENGNLPFSPTQVSDDDLRGEPPDVSLRSYQERAWEKFRETGMVGVYWPPGTGKTFLALYAGERINGQKLVVVPQKTLEEQWKERISEFCDNPDEWDVRTYQYLTYGNNMEKYNDENLSLTMFDECLSGETEIETQDGKISFTELDKKVSLNSGWNEVKDMSVKSYNTKTGKYIWDSVNRIYKTQKPVKEILLEDGDVFYATEGHTHIIIDKDTFKIRETDNIQIGDYLIKPVKKDVTAQMKSRLEETDVFGKNQNVRLLRITDVTEQSHTQTVYDLETRTHRFIADGFLTHNCHRLPANTFSKLSTLQTKYRMGLTASPYRNDDRTQYIFALTGYPVGLNWDEFVDLGVTEYPDVRVYLHRTQRQKVQTAQDLANDPGKMVFFCDEIDAGKKLAQKLNTEFVYGETTNRMEKFRNNRIIVSSRVGDEGMSLPSIDRVIEFSFHGSSRRQEIQRAGRVMHNDSEQGEHLILMTDEEYEKFGDRLLSLEEKGFNIEFVRKA